MLAQALPHFGEEPVLVGRAGCGTLFLAHCNLNCLYCQNYQISQEGLGREVPVESLAREMLQLEALGCPNISWVSPTPYLPFLLEALELAASENLSLPIVYNTHGYETQEALDLLAGVVDLYLPDMKYSDNETARELSQVEDYVTINREAVKTMYAQVGNLSFSEEGWAQRGLIVRHLVLPGNLAGTRETLEFLVSLSPKIWISLMAQYAPCHKAGTHPLLRRMVTAEEYQDSLMILRDLGFQNYFLQDLKSGPNLVPDFSREKPFAFDKEPIRG